MNHKKGSRILNRSEGFTIIEIPIVVSVIVISSGMSIIPVLLGVRGRGLIFGTTAKLKKFDLEPSHLGLTSERVVEPGNFP